MARNRANMGCSCEWSLLWSHSKCFCASSTRRIVAAKRSQVQDVKRQQGFLARLKHGFDFTSWGRCWEVSCFSWPIRDGSCPRAQASLAWKFHLWRAGERERYERVTGKHADEGTGTWIRPRTTQVFYSSIRISLLPRFYLLASLN